jgi:hypothetical protein
VTDMPEDVYTIREDYDPEGDLTADADPVAAYLTYRWENLAEIRWVLKDARYRLAATGPKDN